jgi:GT2 family glycosyltransferase
VSHVSELPQRVVQDDLSVVIPTLGREILQRSLDALASGTRVPAEVIVVDQGQSRRVEEMVEALRARGVAARWMPSAERGRALGVNRGIAAARTRFIAVTDDDCLAHPEWIEQLAARLHAHPGVIITGRVDAGDETVLSAVTSEREDHQRRPRLRFDRLSGGNMAMARDLVARIGYFDEDPAVRTAEDTEYAYRALRGGVSILYAPEAAVTHLGWRDEASREGQYASYARSHGGFLGKYLRQGDLFIALRTLVHIARASRRWLWNTLRGDRERAAHGRAYTLGLLPGLRAGWRSTVTPRRD